MNVVFAFVFVCASKISAVCLWFSAESQVAAVDINY